MAAEALFDGLLSGINMCFRYKQHLTMWCPRFLQAFTANKVSFTSAFYIKTGLFVRRRACSQSKVPQSLLLCDVGVFHSSSSYPMTLG